MNTDIFTYQEPQDLEETKDKGEKTAETAMMVRKEILVIEDQTELEDHKAHKDQLDQLAHKETEELPDLREKPDLSDPLELKDQED